MEWLYWQTKKEAEERQKMTDEWIEWCKNAKTNSN